MSLHTDGPNSIGFVAVHLLVQQPKEAVSKEMTLGAIASCPELCLVATTALFVQKTSSMRAHLAKNHTLFLGFIKGNQPRSIRPSTMGTWIKKTLGECGVDISVHKGHSTRSVAATTARRRGVSVSQI
ncbi:hypothetical protein J3Q64DRAFT_1704259 [Phycomyces blakesleeanus]|uniref:Tyr recombinase domain-containing protein n=1 Tax=Phycomyces blakesleeanus TaxID=4837 RepID=A0ABR3AIK1_PHYBL